MDVVHEIDDGRRRWRDGAYAYDLLNFLRFLLARHATLRDVVPTDMFDYLDWQQRPVPTAGVRVVRLAGRQGAAPASMNRRVAAVRGLFEYAVTRTSVGGTQYAVAFLAVDVRKNAAVDF